MRRILFIAASITRAILIRHVMSYKTVCYLQMENEAIDNLLNYLKKRKDER